MKPFHVFPVIPALVLAATQAGPAMARSSATRTDEAARHDTPSQTMLSQAAPSPETDWQVGIVSLVAIGLVGGSIMLVTNARRRRRTMAMEYAAHEDAAHAHATVGLEPDAAAQDKIEKADAQFAEMVAALSNAEKCDVSAPGPKRPPGDPG